MPKVIFAKILERLLASAHHLGLGLTVNSLENLFWLLFDSKENMPCRLLTRGAELIKNPSCHVLKSITVSTGGHPAYWLSWPMVKCGKNIKLVLSLGDTGLFWWLTSSRTHNDYIKTCSGFIQEQIYNTEWQSTIFPGTLPILSQAFPLIKFLHTVHQRTPSTDQKGNQLNERKYLQITHLIRDWYAKNIKNS